MEEQQSDAYTAFLDTFASDVGSTLEDLATDWYETEYEPRNGARNFQTDSSRASSVRTRTSMDSLDGMADLSLRKARPLAFANPVYDLVNLGGVVIRSRQMTLIPLSQFDINKHPDDSSKQGKHKHSKRGSHGLINKLSHLTKRKHHSLKKHEPEMDVTPPLWTDHASATVSFQENPKRSASLTRTASNAKEEAGTQQTKEKEHRPQTLELEKAEEKTTIKVPPTKVPRSSKGSFTPVSPIKEIVPVINQPDNVFVTDDAQQNDSKNDGSEVKGDNKYLRSGDSTTSLASDISEEAVEENSKTMMEVMHEIEDNDDSSKEDPGIENQEKKEEEAEDEPLLKRNKTLKWSGSRAAPALIREFTRKSKKSGRQPETLATDSPDTADSPAKKTTDSNGIAQQQAGITQSQTDEGKSLRVEKLQNEGSKSHSAPSTPKIRDQSAFTVLSSLLPPAPKLRRTESTKIRMYIHKMGTNNQNALGYATTQFVRQTMQSSEHRPVVLLHSIRSFLTDIKKYLISNPHVGFMTKIQKIVKHTHITDVEGAIDDALERLVLYPLRDHIYKRLVIDYARTGKIRMVEDAIQVGKTKSPQELGIRATLIPPSDEALVIIRQHFTELQSTYSPYYKLKHLLSAVTTIYENTSDLSCEDQSARKIGADDFLPLLVYAIIKCDFTAADIEAQYIDGLLDPTLLLGEGGYYLTTLISAVQVLSSMKKRETPLPNIADLQGFLKVGISSKAEQHARAEKTDDDQQIPETLLLHKTLHVPPSMTAHNLGMMIAKKYGIKNTKDFCLHVVVNGVAYALKPQEFPQLVKMDLLTQFQPKSFYFVYRQIDKTPEKSSERPVTIDTEHLRVNTEEGKQAELTSEGEADGGDQAETKEATEDSESGKESSAGESSNEDLPPPPPDLVSSPGFDNIPLPEAFFQHDTMPQEVVAPQSNEGTTSQDVMPPSTGEMSQDIETLIPDEGKAQIDATPPVDTMPPDGAVGESIGSQNAKDSNVALETINQSSTKIVNVPKDEEIPPPAEETLATTPVAVNQQENTSSTIIPPISDPAQDSLPSPLSQDDTSPPATIVPPVSNPQQDVLPSPPLLHEIPPIEESSLPQPDATLLHTDQSHKLPDTDRLFTQRPASPLVERTKREHTKYMCDSSETDTSSDEAQIDLSYQSATLVDDMLTPVKKMPARPKPPRKSKNVGIPSPTKPENKDITQEMLSDSQTLILEDSSQSNSQMEEEKLQNPESKSEEVPYVTLTDVSDHELEALSDVSSVSDGRQSASCRSEGNYGSNEDGRHSGRGYHSDGHQIDESSHKVTDLGAASTVSTLKNFFEEEISKVSEDAAKLAPTHSPK